MTNRNKEKEPNIAIYARVSTVGKGQDVDLQLRDLRAYVASRGLSIFKNMSMMEYRAGKINALLLTP